VHLFYYFTKSDTSINKLKAIVIIWGLGRGESKIDHGICTREQKLSTTKT